MLTKAERLWLRIGSALLLVAWTWFVGRYVAVLGIPWLMGVLLAYLPPFLCARAGLAARRFLAHGCWCWLHGDEHWPYALSDARHFPEIRLVIGKSWNLPIADLILSVFVTLLMWVTLYCAKGGLPRAYVWLSQRPARSSYTLYLVHMPAALMPS